MKIRVMSSKNEIHELNPSEQIIHMAFRPSNIDLLELIRKCPRLRAIQMPRSHMKTMADSTQKFLNMHGIDLLEGDVWNHRKALDEYVVIEDETLNRIKALINEGVGLNAIRTKVRTAARLNPDLIKYIQKTASST
jgi:hypothetical protein